MPRRTLRIEPVLLAALLCAGCTNLSGVSEFRAYDAAIDNLSSGTAAMADYLRVAEKKEAIALIDHGVGEGATMEAVPVNGVTAGVPRFGIAPRFQPAHATYFSETADPPLTAALVRSVSALSHYNDALSVYAEGRGLEAATSSLVGLSHDLRAGLAALGPTVPGLGTGAEVLQQGVGVAGTVGSREAFRTELTARGAKLDELLVGLRVASTEVFANLTAEEMDELKSVPSDARKAELIETVRAKRRVVAEWVLLVDLARDALAALRAAVAAEPSLAASAASGAELAAEARARAEAIRRILAER